MNIGQVFAHKLVPDIGPNGDCYGYAEIRSEINIEHIAGLLSELESIRAENARLKEWIYAGRYSAK